MDVDSQVSSTEGRLTGSTEQRAMHWLAVEKEIDRDVLRKVLNRERGH